MAVLSNDGIRAGASAAGGYNVKKSCRFDGAGDGYLNRTFASGGSTTTWTLSFWVKGHDLAQACYVLTGGTGTSSYINAFDVGQFRFYSSAHDLKSTARYRDPSAWYHIVVVANTTDSTENDRTKVYINGTRLAVTDFATHTQPSQNAALGDFNAAGTHYINRLTSGSQQDMMLAEVHFVDAAAKEASDFGETDSITGQWIPKKYAGSYGTTGFHLKFEDTSDIGKDSSGNSNDFTSNNITGTDNSNPENIDILDDAPGAPYDNGLNGGGNYATLNPIDSATTVSNGNLNVTGGGNSFQAVRSTMGMKTGKWYFEGKHVALSSDTSSGFGIWDDTKTTSQLDSGGGAYGNNYIVVYEYAGNIMYVLGGSSTTIQAGSIVSGDVLGFALDLDNGTLKVHHNGTYLNSGNSIYNTWPDRTYFFGGYEYNTGNTLAFNFGQQAFKYTVPAGYKALNAYNLADPTITKGSTVFDIKTYTGATAGVTVSGLSFSPDMVWIKNRTSAVNHALMNTISGNGKYLQTDSNADEETGWGNSLTSDGFSFTDTGSGLYNENNSAHVAWCWDAGSAGSNTSVSAGGLNSTVYNTGSWVSDTTASNMESSHSLTTIFNGQAGGGIHGSLGNTLHLQWSSGTINGNVRLKLITYGTAAHSYKDNSGSAIDITSSVTSTMAWVDLGNVNLTDFYGTTPSSGNAAAIEAIELDGKILVDSGQTPTNVPTLASAYRVNTDAGFSVVTYTGNSTTGATVAHGLGAKPDFMIFKSKNYEYNWTVYHKDIGNTHGFYLDTNGAKQDNNTFWNDTDPTSTIITLGNDGGTNYNGSNIVAYCWSEVAGYSKFGKYDGNGSGNSAVDGPFQWCGFTPRFIIIKQSDGTNNWIMLDTVRNTYNGGTTEQFLYPNLTNAENTYAGDVIDVLSNGWRPIHGEGGINNTNDTYIWAAFAESPFKYANAR